MSTLPRYDVPLQAVERQVEITPDLLTDEAILPVLWQTLETMLSVTLGMLAMLWLLHGR